MRRFKRPKRIVKTACSMQTAEGNIPFTLARSTGRRTLTITIDESAEVSVASPFNMKEKEIHDFVKEKARWIMDKIEEANRNKAILNSKVFDHGHRFLFLGKKHKINIIERDVLRSSITFDVLNGWSVTVPYGLSCQERQERVKTKMLQWYRMQAKEILGGRTYHYSRILGIEPKKITIRTQKRLWGCCDYNTQAIYLNWQIILSPIKVVDYVVAHELCHLVVPNHSKRFWKKVEKVMPDFRPYRQWLKVNQLDMVLP